MPRNQEKVHRLCLVHDDNTLIERAAFGTQMQLFRQAEEIFELCDSRKFATLNPMQTLSLALESVRKHRRVVGTHHHYPGIVSLHALARLASETRDPEIIREAREALLPMATGAVRFPCNFPNYQCGGNAGAWLFSQGLLPEGRDEIAAFVDLTLEKSERDAEGLICHPKFPGEGRIFIDAAFAVCPFLLFAGLGLGREDAMAEAWRQVSGMVEILHDPETGLLHQCRGFIGAGRITPDHWSRGNGWGVYALTELAAHLPEGAGREAARDLVRRLLEACVKWRNPQIGLWHQEMTQHGNSYVETSGSALILYAIGAGLWAGYLGGNFRSPFEAGIQALTAYITPDLDIFHTCTGCLAPGTGSVLDYMARPTRRNDPHGFGPVALAMGQAHLLGMTEIRSS